MTEQGRVCPELAWSQEGAGGGQQGLRLGGKWEKWGTRGGLEGHVVSTHGSPASASYNRGQVWGWVNFWLAQPWVWVALGRGTERFT